MMSGKSLNVSTATTGRSKLFTNPFFDRTSHRQSLANSLMALLFLMALFGRQSWVLTTEEIGKACYPCHEINRKWASNFCENRIDDCGDCYPGCKLQENDTCALPSQVTVQSGESSLIPKGSTVVLKCTYEWLEDCIWTRGRYGVDIDRSDRYHLLTPDIRHSKDCSLKIDDFQDIDVDEWGCHIFTASEPNESAEVKYLWLNVYDSKILPVKENEVARVPVGETVMLICHLEEKADCRWTKNDVSQEIKSRYRYDPHGYRNHKDCTIIISNFQPDDEGKWQCQDNEMKQTASIFHLKQISRKMKVIEEPEDKVVTLKANAMLRCRFNLNTTCVWERNGKEISIAGRYQFIDGKNGKDTAECSIQILKVQPQDLGQWKCSHAGKEIADKIASKSALLMVSPETQLSSVDAETGRKKRSSSDAEMTLVCSATLGFPEAKIHWETGGRRRAAVSNLTVDDRGLVNVTSTIAVPLMNLRSAKCVVSHPSFPTSKAFDASDAKLRGKDACGVSNVRVVYVESTTNKTTIITTMLFAAISVMLGIILTYTCIKERKRRTASYPSFDKNNKRYLSEKSNSCEIQQLICRKAIPDPMRSWTDRIDIRLPLTPKTDCCQSSSAT